MTTLRLFEHDAYVTEFEAKIVGILEVDEKKGVVLDRTFFYPTGGGQPHDIGKIGGHRVVDVVESGDSIVHILDDEKDFSEGTVRGSLDWSVRFDHMQQHTGQHILSAAFVVVAKANTRGFHLGSEGVTIDLDRADIDWPIALCIERWINEKVNENHLIRIVEVPEADVHQIPFRRQPKIEGKLRVVEIEDVDWSACCGTHTRSTCEVGLIKIVRLERYKGGTRVHFVCGDRALAFVQRKQAAIDALAPLLSVSDVEVPEAVERLQHENKILRKTLREREKTLLEFEAIHLAETSNKIGSVSVVNAILDFGDMKVLQQLARTLKELPDRVVILGSITERANVVVARSENVAFDVRPLLNEVCRKIDGRGGGSASMAQGSGPQIEKLPEALEEAQALIVGFSTE
ncbi:hypothetical protein KAR48_05000 [bacterium]|nr:hypothetical protein [bacterium]